MAIFDGGLGFTDMNAPESLTASIAGILRLHERYPHESGRRKSDSAHAVQPGFSEPFANAFWSWEAAVPNETKLDEAVKKAGIQKIASDVPNGPEVR